MKKLLLVAQFVRYWNAVCTNEQAERLVYAAFLANHSQADFLRWNTPVDRAWAASFFLANKDEPRIDLLWVIEALYEIR